MDTQTWICKYDLGTCRGVPEGFSVILVRFPLSILHFRGFWQVFLFVGDFSQDFDRFSDWQMIFLWDIDMHTWICKYDLGLVGGSARGGFCDFATFSFFNFAFPGFWQVFLFVSVFLGFWQVFRLVSDFSMRHRHADMDMQMWLGTCRGVPEGISVILTRFLLSILHGFPFCKRFS